MVRTFVASEPRAQRKEALRPARAALTLLCVLAAAATGAGCKKNQDPYEPRARRAMTVADLADGDVPPTSTAEGPEVERARVTMTALRAVVGFWRIEHGNRTRCPTLRDLAAAPSSGFDPNTMTRDPWGSPFEVDCLGGVVRLRSLGPDKQPETADDVIRY
jgi:hypothetical protein